MNYQVVHDKIIVNAILRGKPTGYCEAHHIIPKSFYDGKYTSFTKYPWNRVYLTAKEHFIVHKLLVKIYKDKDIDKHRKMAYAINMMSRPCSATNNRIILTSANYEFIRTELATVTMSDDQRKKLSVSRMGKDPWNKGILCPTNKAAWNKGIPCTDERKSKLSVALKGEKNPFYGKAHSPEVIEKIREGNRGKHVVHTSETRAKMRSAKLGDKNPNYGKPATNSGKPHNEATKEKIREKAQGRLHSENARANMVHAAERKNLRKLAVLFTM